MSFDWIDFLEQYGIPYTTKSRNISSGNIGIRCPFCTDDPSEHMSISLSGEGWSCWRNRDHRGKNPVRMVMALTNMSKEQAGKLVYGDSGPRVPEEDLLEAVSKSLGIALPQVTVSSFDMPKNFRSLSKPGVLGRPVFKYTMSRGYSEHEVRQLAERYELKYALDGPWTGRVIFPIRDAQGSLVNLVGRDITGRSDLRYKTVSRNESPVSISGCLFDLPRLVSPGADILVVTEGPFDAMRVSWYGESIGVRSTCLFTVRISTDQISMLNTITSLYRKVVFVLDASASVEMAALTTFMMAGIHPITAKDPGEMTASEIRSLCRALA